MAENPPDPQDIPPEEAPENPPADSQEAPPDSPPENPEEQAQDPSQQASSDVPELPEEFIQAGVPIEGEAQPAEEQPQQAAEEQPQQQEPAPEPVAEEPAPAEEEPLIEERVLPTSPLPEAAPEEQPVAEEQPAQPETAPEEPPAEEPVSEEVTIQQPLPLPPQAGQPASESGPAQWFYMKPNHTDTVGPITSDELKHLFAQAKISKNTMIWCEGMEQWEEIGKLIAFQKTEKVKLSISSHGSVKPTEGAGGEGGEGGEDK